MQQLAWDQTGGKPDRVGAGVFTGGPSVSGIYGVVRCDGAPVAREALAPIAAAMSFWGRNGHGQWCGDSAGLGHFMLHTTPESLYERMPASIRAAPHLVVTADARIDNRDELFSALGVPGPGRRETPDSSLILLAYERWGPDCVKRFLGDFAFAIRDNRERTLFCARDPFGCRPFVYRHGAQRFIFASDVKGVLAGIDSVGIDAPRLNESLLAAYLQMNTCHAEKRLTFFEGIVKLPPAHTLTVTATGVEISRYWSPEDAPEFRLASEADYAEQLGYLFRQSVECRLRSAFPIGSHLSGGLDSSAVAILASRMLRERGGELAAFSWSPPPGISAGSHPEGEYARIDAVCLQERLACEYVPLTKASLIETFQRDFTVDPMLMMARESGVQARAEERHLRIMLSGWGGDEAATCRAITGPAGFMTSHRWVDFRTAVGLRLRATTPVAGARALGGILRDLLLLQLPDSLYRLTGADPFMTHRAPCIQPAFARLHRHEMKDLRIPALRRLPGVRARICRLLEMGHVPLRMEHWAGSGARHGVVYRYPMLDKRLVEFVLGVPPSPIRQLDQRRSLFRRAMGDLLPPSADWRVAKTEEATLMALKSEFIQAHADWARHLDLEKAGSAANRFVDPARIRRAVDSAVRSGQREGLSGVHEAFGCYAIRGM